MSRERARSEKLLSGALDHIDEAIQLLREYARGKGDEAEPIEDIIYLLEEAGEALEKIIRARKQED